MVNDVMQCRVLLRRNRRRGYGRYGRHCDRFWCRCDDDWSNFEHRSKSERQSDRCWFGHQRRRRHNWFWSRGWGRWSGFYCNRNGNLCRSSTVGGLAHNKHKESPSDSKRRQPRAVQCGEIKPAGYWRQSVHQKQRVPRAAGKPRNNITPVRQPVLEQKDAECKHNKQPLKQKRGGKEDGGVAAEHVHSHRRQAGDDNKKKSGRQRLARPRGLTRVRRGPPRRGGGSQKGAQKAR